jgi:hypothetical protein
LESLQLTLELAKVQLPVQHCPPSHCSLGWLTLPSPHVGVGVGVGAGGAGNPTPAAPPPVTSVAAQPPDPPVGARVNCVYETFRAFPASPE